MDTVYLICAGVGGTFLVLQTLLLLLGLGGDADADLDSVDVDSVDVDHVDVHDADASDVAFKVLSAKTLIAFLAFFGLAGLAGQNAAMAPTPVLLVAVGAGSVAVFVVAYIMAGLAKLQSQGNVDLRNAVGAVGRVYLRVPGENSGQGKVTIEVQGRKLQCRAFTAGPELPTGARVRVVAATGDNAVEVQVLS